jgi:hypothetical protein
MAARLRLGVAECEAEASAHDTAVHHVRHPGFKHIARYTLHSMKPSRARADMREASQREGSGVVKASGELGKGFLSAARQWLVAGLRHPRPTIAQWQAAATNSPPTTQGKKGTIQGQEQRRTR